MAESSRIVVVGDVSSIAQTVQATELKAHALRATALLKAMSNPARLMVLCQLAEGEKSVGELESAVSLSQSGLSQHLALLRRESIAVTRRQGQTIFYRLSSEEAAAVMRTLYAIFCGQTAGKRPSRAAPKINGARRRRA
jgi:ArsR family transcriptional regulator, virulence genes transcriptional regulator